LRPFLESNVGERRLLLALPFSRETHGLQELCGRDGLLRVVWRTEERLGQERQFAERSPTQPQALLCHSPQSQGQTRGVALREVDHLEGAERKEAVAGVVNLFLGGELLDAGVEDVVYGTSGRDIDELTDVRPVHEGEVDTSRDVTGGQDEDVGEVLDGVDLGEKSIDGPDSVAAVIGSVLPVSCQGLNLVNENTHQHSGIVNHLFDLGEHLLDQLTRLGEPFGEEAVGVYLYELPVFVSVLHPDAEFLSQSLA